LATQVNGSIRSKTAGGLHVHSLNVTLITSGTTTTFTFPISWSVLGVIFLNVTTGAVNPIGGTYVPATGVWTSPTMAVNDVAVVTIFTE
jgi:hypothetical protein